MGCGGEIEIERIVRERVIDLKNERFGVAYRKRDSEVRL